MLSRITAFIVSIFTCTVMAYSDYPIISSRERIIVSYYSVQSNGTCCRGSAVLQGASTESQIRNQLAARHVRGIIRVTAVRCVNAKSVYFLVKYRAISANGSTSTGTARLRDTLTESMARNELLTRHHGADIEILSMNQQ